MKRREFLQATAASLLMASQSGYAQSIGQTIGDAALRLNPAIWPEERVEKREYDNSRPDVVVWHTAPYQMTYPKKEVTRTVGFVEKVSAESKILYIPGFLLRPDLQPNRFGIVIPQLPRDGDGFYFYFSTTLAWLALPRRTSKAPDVIQDRYAFDEQFSVNSTDGFPADFASFDCQEIKLIEAGRTYKPTHMQYRPVSNDGVLLDVAPSWVPARRTIFPGKNFKHPSLGFEKIVYFDIAHRPLRFKVELPPLVIQGIEVPLPVCYFEPFDEISNKWVD